MSESIMKIPTLKIITVATSEEGYLRVLRHQLKKSNINHKILGYEQKWGGWVWRTNLLLNYLKSIDPNDIVMVIDGYDVLMVGNEKDIIKKYLDFKTDIVFGVHLSESQSFSPFVEYISHPIAQTYFNTYEKHMKNGGSFMGSSKSLITVYERILKYSQDTNTTDDQLALNNILLDDIDHKLDTKSQIFWIWDPDSVYELLYALINKELSRDLGPSIKSQNMRPIFTNGIKPEIVHGAGHRDMTRFVDQNLEFYHVSRNYVQEDLDLIINSIRCVVCIMIILVLVFLYWYFYHRKTNEIM
jgi:hypothetical protein